MNSTQTEMQQINEPSGDRKDEVQAMSKTNFKSTIRKVMTGACVAIACAAAIPSAAHGPADGQLGDPEAAKRFNAWNQTVYSTFVAEVTNQFFAINTYLAKIYSYLREDTGENGAGVNGTARKIFDEQRRFQQALGQNQEQMNRVSQIDGAVAQAQAKRLPDPRTCSEIPGVMGARMAAGGGGGARTAAKGSTEAAVAGNGAATALSATGQAGNIATTHAAKYCAKTDFEYTNGQRHAAFGCTAASPMPDAHARVQSIFVPAHDFDNKTVSAKSNITFSTPEETQAAKDASVMIISAFSPTALPKDMEGTAEGITYLSKTKAFAARISAATHALAQIGSQRAAATSMSDGVKKAWDESSTSVYTNVFKGMTRPEKPSSAEVTRFEVMRRYADSGSGSWYQKSIKDQDESRLLQELNQTAAVSLYVNWEIMNRLEENNALQASILSQLVNPITKQELESSSRAAFGAKR